MEYWNLDRTAGTGNAVVTLYWESATYSGIFDCTTTDLRIAHWNGSAWENNNESVTTSGSCTGATPGSISTSAVVTAFSPFTFGSKNSNMSINPLPIQLSEFKAVCADDRTKLAWTTETELKNSNFILERSAEGNEWTRVATIEGSKINSVSRREYSFTDSNNSNESLMYYRLTQVDEVGGKMQFFTTYVNCGSAGTGQLELIPNPASGSVRLDLTLPGNYGDGTLELTDNLGCVRYRQAVRLNEGLNSYTVPLDLPAGIYIVGFTSENVVIPAKKLIVE
jgi:hypothetical protein